MQKEIEEKFKELATYSKQHAMAVLDRIEMMDEAQSLAVIDLELNIIKAEIVSKQKFDIDDIRRRFLNASESKEDTN